MTMMIMMIMFMMMKRNRRGRGGRRRKKKKKKKRRMRRKRWMEREKIKRGEELVPEEVEDEEGRWRNTERERGGGQ